MKKGEFWRRGQEREMMIPRYPDDASQEDKARSGEREGKKKRRVGGKGGE